MNYQIQGLSIHAEVHGTAEPALVFLHYWGGTSRTWRKVTAELAGQFKTVAYDARGWEKGRRKKVDEKGRQTGRSPIRYVSVAVSCRPVPGFPTRNQAVRVCTYNGTSFAH
jgi:pimeloyl-ACP methyl ester carboxylesterase